MKLPLNWTRGMRERMRDHRQCKKVCSCYYFVSRRLGGGKNLSSIARRSYNVSPNFDQPVVQT